MVLSKVTGRVSIRAICYNCSKFYRNIMFDGIAGELKCFDSGLISLLNTKLQLKYGQGTSQTSFFNWYIFLSVTYLSGEGLT